MLMDETGFMSTLLKCEPIDCLGAIRVIMSMLAADLFLSGAQAVLC